MSAEGRLTCAGSLGSERCLTLRRSADGKSSKLELSPAHLQRGVDQWRLIR